MRRLVIFLLIVASLVQILHKDADAAGSCVRTSKELIQVAGQTQRTYITLTCTGDGSIGAYSFVPSTEGVRGQYLYNVTTNPGTAPTDQYDITLISDGEDIAGSLLLNRSSTLTQTVVIAPPSLGYHMADKTIAITFANNTANPSVIVITLRFTIN